MRFELNLASIALLALVAALWIHDYVSYRGRARHMLALETLAFLAGAGFIAFPDMATGLARAVGIGRGVDFLLYPTVIWLVRESLLMRRHRYEQEARMSEVVRSIAIEQAREVNAD